MVSYKYAPSSSLPAPLHVLMVTSVDQCNRCSVQVGLSCCEHLVLHCRRALQRTSGSVSRDTQGRGGTTQPEVGASPASHQWRWCGCNAWCKIQGRRRRACSSQWYFNRGSEVFSEWKRRNKRKTKRWHARHHPPPAMRRPAVRRPPSTEPIVQHHHPQRRYTHCSGHQVASHTSHRATCERRG
jgi:hypothetical protein